MEDKTNVGFKIHELGKLLRKAVNCGVERKGIDPMVIQRGWIIGYIKHHEDQIICQCDIETKFHLPKSTATDTLQVLEKEGIIERVPVENDARRKRIVLTEKGQNFSRMTEAQIEDVERYITSDITEEEYAVFVSVIEKIRQKAIEYRMIEEEK